MLDRWLAKLPKFIRIILGIVIINIGLFFVPKIIIFTIAGIVIISIGIYIGIIFPLPSEEEATQKQNKDFYDGKVF